MKNRYRHLKTKIMTHTFLISAGISFLAFIILKIFVDGIFQDPFAKWFIRMLESFGFDNGYALELYHVLLRNNKDTFMWIALMIVLFISFFIGMSKFERYLNQLEDGIEDILKETDGEIKLDNELQPMEAKLNTIKTTLQRREFIAKDQEQRKNDLVVYLAHDLKTPLTSVIAYLNLLVEVPDMPMEQRAKYTKISFEKAVRLGELINEFFEITRFNLQSITLEKGEMDLYLLLEQLKDAFEPILSERKMTCTVTVEEDLTLIGDSDRLARVFDNLLRNAIAYSYEQTNIDIDAKRVDSMAEITFTNKGRMIPAHKIENLFEKFFRLDESRGTNSGGAGLGLAIAKEIVELHEGKIIACSDESKTQFVVCLPLHSLAGEDTISS